MKNAHKVAALLALAGLAPFASSAITVEQAYIESCRKTAGFPVPRVVVMPHVGAGHAGEKVEVEFTVSPTGQTSAFSLKSHVDDELAGAVVDALKHWEFVPAQRNGVPVATKVVLPMRIVNSDAFTSTR